MWVERERPSGCATCVGETRRTGQATSTGSAVSPPFISGHHAHVEELCERFHTFAHVLLEFGTDHEDPRRTLRPDLPHFRGVTTTFPCHPPTKPRSTRKSPPSASYLWKTRGTFPAVDTRTLHPRKTPLAPAAQSTLSRPRPCVPPPASARPQDTRVAGTPPTTRIASPHAPRKEER